MEAKLAHLLRHVQRLAYIHAYAPRYLLVMDLREDRYARFQDSATFDLILEARGRGLLLEIGRQNYQGAGYVLTREGEAWLQGQRQTRIAAGIHETQ